MNPNIIKQSVEMTLSEDVGSGDITGELIPESRFATAKIVTRETAVICGVAWVEEVYCQLNGEVEIEWRVSDGDVINQGETLALLKGPARILVTGERVALNWLQTLSGTATLVRHYADLLKGTRTKLLDTRKTIPGLRKAQKYAVKCGGGENHRMGLYDAFLIKENHIAACGSIAASVKMARKNHPEKLIEVEVENEDELKEALECSVDIVMLDNFDLEQMRRAVEINSGRVKLEVSGNVTDDQIKKIAETGVDFISVGALTKNLSAIDLSMRIEKVSGSRF